MSAPSPTAFSPPPKEHPGRAPSVDLWRLGDWLLEDRDERGYARQARIDLALRALKAAGSAISREHAYLAVYVARAIEPDRRRPELPWSAHREVAHLDPDAQDRFLGLAKREGWSCTQLRSRLRATAEGA